jgi:7,8-dihydropterin-6-yl-methyl-4-(beta-D-ribofuranosyl)aminobenzene 5'-phosphate synthase
VVGDEPSVQVIHLVLDDAGPEALEGQRDGPAVVLLDCAHAGVVNTLLRVESLTSGPVHAVIGGMHLAGAGPERIAATARALADRGVACVVPCHCTGLLATAALARELGDRCTPGHAGLVLELED